jgi:putative ABC transport system permease protein
MERMYRLGLRLYPSEFRHLHEAEMLQVFRARAAAARRRGGRPGVLGLLTRELLDVAATALPQRLEALRKVFDLHHGGERMSSSLQDLRYALRQALLRPGFTLVAVLTLALGIGANTAVFSVVNAVLLQPLPFGEPERLVWLASFGKSESSMSPLDFQDLRDRGTKLESAAAMYWRRLNLTGDGAEPERIAGYAVTPELFSVLQVPPALGRAFERQDAAPGAARVTVLSHGLWQRRFGADPAVVGRSITLNGNSTLVVGVAPAGFRFPASAEAWTPLGFTAEDLEPKQRGARYLRSVARLKPGVTAAAAQAELDVLARGIELANPDTNQGIGVSVVPLHARLVREVRPALLVLLGAVGLVLLLACANVANLFLMRTAARQAEVAIRTSLGASRFRLVRQLLTEALLLALLGGGLGMLLATWSLDALLALSPADLPRLEEVRIDRAVLGFTSLAAVATGLLFGLAPALQASRADLAAALRRGGRGLTPGHRRLRSVLVVSQMALALLLLAGSGLLVKTFVKLRQVEPGFDASGVLTFTLTLPSARYPGSQQVRELYERLIEWLEVLPGVQAAGTIFGLPLGAMNANSTFGVSGRPRPRTDPVAYLRVVGGDYFRALRIPFRRGRLFDRRDRAGSPGVALLNEEAARRYWPGEDPVGQRLRAHVSMTDERQVPREIVGIVADVKHRGLDLAAEPEIYIPHAQHAVDSLTFVLRAGGDPLSLLDAAREQVWALDRELPLANVQTMEAILSASVADKRFTMQLFSAFAGLALLLAALGIYGVVSYAVGLRTREIGVRMALGATRGQVLRMVLGQSLRLTAAGLALGLAGTLALARLIEGLLYGVAPRDLPTLALVSAMLGAAALLASLLPARRAARVDPMSVLRWE